MKIYGVRKQATLIATASLIAGALIPAAWAHAPGRLTGGGSIYCPGVERVTHGFELHCGTGTNPEGSNPPKPNNLEVNFANGDHFHLRILEVANCTTDPAIDSGAPLAPFNTMTGSGTGWFNGAPATIEFVMTDAGEPGAGVDFANFLIKVETTTVLSCGSYLEGGNHQAHTATGIKQ